MKKTIFAIAVMVNAAVTFAQNTDPDTVRMNIGTREVIIIKSSSTTVVDVEGGEKKKKEYSNDGRWAGVDFGINMLMNNQFQTKFPADKHWENDPSKSFNWNLNLFDRRINLYKDYVGITTGLGFNFTQVGFKNNRLLKENADSIWSVIDTVNNYSKNKLRATYLQVPLLLEFNTNSDPDKSFHFLAGVIGGVRIGSSMKTKIASGNTKERTKGTFGLNPFKLDATVRAGYGDWGIYANYALISMFDKEKTTEVYPLSFGISFSF